MKTAFQSNLSRTRDEVHALASHLRIAAKYDEDAAFMKIVAGTVATLITTFHLRYKSSAYEPRKKD